MNRLKYLTYLLGMVLLLSACSKDEEEVAPEETWKEAQVGLFVEDGRDIKVPDAMAQADDPHVYMVNSYILQATLMPSLYGSMFIMPEEGVEKRSSPITATNGRMAANDYWVYEWGTDTASFVYQFYEDGDKQHFEMFMSTKSQGTVKWMEIVQNKNGKSGTMKLFDEIGVSMTWTWEIRSDESYYFTMTAEDFKYEIVSNKDLSGSIKSYSDGNLDREMQWDSAGNGSWKEYESGSLVDQGEWTV